MSWFKFLKGACLVKQKFKILLLNIIVLTFGNIWAADIEEGGNEIRLFQYSSLAAMGPEIIGEFKRVGYIAVEGVPGFADAYQRYLGFMRQFIDLPPEEQAKYTPSNYGARGWSRGVEVFNGKCDTFKGSFYAAIPDDASNIWPEESLTGFKEAYLDVATLVLNVGREILPLVGFTQSVKGLGRGLHYKSVSGSEDDGNPNWCGNHRDHGVFTCLCPEVYFDEEGNIVDRPEGAGLYIESKPVAPRRDIMLFQMGEVMELMTNGAVRATDHLVKKAFGPERYALAVFADPEEEVIINFSDSSVIEKYKDRLTEEDIAHGSVSFAAWNDRSLAKYNPKELDPTT